MKETLGDRELTLPYIATNNMEAGVRYGIHDDDR